MLTANPLRGWLHFTEKHSLQLKESMNHSQQFVDMLVPVPPILSLRLMTPRSYATIDRQYSPGNPRSLI